MIKEAEWRLPWWSVFLLSIALVSTLAWWNVRRYDFLQPPSQEQLQQIRTRTEIDLRQNFIPAPEDKVILSNKTQLDLPLADTQIATQQIKINPSDLGDFAVLPALDAYSWIAETEGSKMVVMATELESMGQYQRALLAWERVIDHCEVNQDQGELALRSIIRLKASLPQWNVDPLGALPLNLEIAANKNLITSLKEYHIKLLDLLKQASSGLIIPNIEWVVTPLPEIVNASAPNASVALTLTGQQTKLMRSKTLIVSLTADNQNSAEKILLDAVYKLLRDMIRSKADLKAPFAPTATFGSEVLISQAITRWSWQELARTMNTKP